jgi:hypothetical protein
MTLPMKNTLLLASISALLLSACSDPKDPTKENFKAAISSSLERQTQTNPSSTQMCFPVPGAEVDGNAVTAKILTPGDDPASERIRGSRAFALLESLHSTGFANRDSQTDRLFTREVKYSVYTIDPAKVPIVTTEVIGLLEPKVEVCGGPLTVADITSFTEPSDSPMGRVVTVDARMRVESPAPWLTTDALLAANPELKQSLSDGFDRKFYLVLKDTGWETIETPLEQLRPSSILSP